MIAASSLEAPHVRLPVTIVTGFLGSGKTTLLGRLLRDPRMQNVAVIVNEFGALGLDDVLVSRPDEQTYLLNNGCLCCSVRGELVETLSRLLLRWANAEIPAFNRVAIETTGLAEPVPVLLSIVGEEALREHYRLDGLLATIDAVNGWEQLDEHAACVKQVTAADALLVTKTDIAASGDVALLHGRLRKLNPAADIRDVVDGEVDLRHVLGIHPEDDSSPSFAAAKWLASAASGTGGPEAPEPRRHPAGHSHDDGRIRTFSMRRAGEVSPAGLSMWIDMIGAFRGPDLLRIKGLVNVAGRPVVVQAVQHLFHPPVFLADWPDEDRSSRLTFITRDLRQADIERTMSALDLELHGSSAEGSFDAGGYRRFLDALAGFRPRHAAARSSRSVDEMLSERADHAAHQAGEVGGDV